MKPSKIVIDKLIACLKELPDGTEITTSQLMKIAGLLPRDSRSQDLMEIHFALFDAVENEPIILDMSKHENKFEGLPYNLDYMVIHKK